MSRDEPAADEIDVFIKSMISFFGLENEFARKLREAPYAYEFLDRHEGARMACVAFAQFIDGRAPEAKALAAPFLAMAVGFQDLKKGISPEIFSLRGDQKKRSRSGEFKHVKRWVAALLETLMVLPDDVRVAKGLPSGETNLAAYVARQAKNWPSLREADVSAVTVINWRKHLRATRTEVEALLFQKLCDALLNESDIVSSVIQFLREGPPGLPKQLS